MKKIFILISALALMVSLSAKGSYYRFVEMNREREFVGVEPVVEGEAKKIECFSFKYDKQKRPVEITSMTKMKKRDCSLAGLGENIAQLKIEYKDTIRTAFNSVSNDTDSFAVTEVEYTAFNRLDERVPMRGNVYRMVHFFERPIIGGETAYEEDFTMNWLNYGEDGYLCDDLYGVKQYYLEFISEGGISKVVSTRYGGEESVIKDNNGVSQILFEYDDAGRLVFQTYRDMMGQRINGANGYCEMRIARADSEGVMTETDLFFDKEGKATVNMSGVHGVKRSFDVNKYLTSTLYLDTLGRVGASLKGISYARYIRDKEFYVIKNEYFTSVKDSVKKTPPMLKVEGVPMFFLYSEDYVYDKSGFLSEVKK